jgi:hypothetical protein
MASLRAAEANTWLLQALREFAADSLQIAANSLVYAIFDCSRECPKG